MKILPKMIESCGVCPYFLVMDTNWNNGQCKLLLAQFILSPICYPHSISPECPLEDYTIMENELK